MTVHPSFCFRLSVSPYPHPIDPEKLPSLGVALLRPNYIGGHGYEFGADEGSTDFNDLKATSTSPGSWFDFFTLDKNSFNDYERPKDKFGSTRTFLDETTRHLCPTQLSAESLPTPSTTQDVLISDARASDGNKPAENQPLKIQDATKESSSPNKLPNHASVKKSEAPLGEKMEQQHDETRKPVSFLRRIYELRKAFQTYQSISMTEDDIVTCDIGLDDFEVLLWFDSEQNTRSAWSEPSTQKVPYSRFLQRQVHLQPRSDSFLRQFCVLRDAFQQNPSPSISEIEQIGCETGLDDFEVSFWFETEKRIQLECLTTCIPFQQDPWSPQFSHSSMYSRSSLTGTSLVSDNVKLNHPNHPEPGLAGNLHMDLAQWETPSLAARSNKRRRPVHTSSNATSASTSLPPNKRLQKNKVQGLYPCLFESCDSIALDVLKWRDHQLRSHFPKRVWICWLKKDDGSDCKHGPVTRSDNFVTHLVNEHHKSRGTGLQQLVQSKGLNVRNLYHEECGFCTRKLKSWEDSMKHISDHLRKGSGAEAWEHRCSTEHDLVSHIEHQLGELVPSGHNEKPKDEDERDDDPNPNGNRGVDSTFEDSNRNSQDPEPQNDESQESGDHTDQGDRTSPTQNDAEDNDMQDDFQDLYSDTATISVQANEADTDYVSLEMLGHGGFSFVDKIVHRHSKKIYARKTTFCHKSPPGESVESLFQNEVEILKTLQHPHLIKFIDAYRLQDRLSIIMSPVADESLTSFMSRFGQFPVDLQEKNKSSLWRWISCLASALAYLHGHLIRHQDIKPSNILIRGDQIFLADFGNAKKFLDDNQAQVCDFRNKLTVTPMYCPPEAMRSGLQGFTADIFSLGCVYAEIVTLCLDQTLTDFELFRSPNQYDGAFRNQLEKTVEWIESLQEDYKQAALNHAAPSSVSLEMICLMLYQDPEQRPTARQIQLQLLPCTCCSTTVIAIETTQDVRPIYPSTVESALGQDGNSNILPQARTTKPETIITLETEEPPLQGPEENHTLQISVASKEKMRVVPRPAYISDCDSDTDTRQIISRQNTNSGRIMTLYKTPRAAAKTPSELPKPHISRKAPIKHGSYYDKPFHDREKDKGHYREYSTDDSSSESEGTEVRASSSGSDIYDSETIPSSRPSAISISENVQGKAIRVGDKTTRQHTRFDSSNDNSRARRPTRCSPHERFDLARVGVNPDKSYDDAIAEAFAAGCAAAALIDYQGRARKQPTPPLTNASSSVRSSIESRSTDSRSPRESFGSNVSIDGNTFRLREDFKFEDPEDYLHRSRFREQKLRDAEFDYGYIPFRRDQLF